MAGRRHHDQDTLVGAARERRSITLDELITAARSSPVVTADVVDLARQARLGLSERDGEGWEELGKLAEEGEAAFAVVREAPAPREEEFAAGSPATVYLREISRTPLLTPDEEVALAKQLEAGGEAQRTLQAGVEDPAERAAVEETVWAGKQARNRLIESNLRLVVSIAKRYLGRGLSFLDLVQEGNIGLQKGVDRYDWRKGFRFSTYAYWWIRQAIGRAVADQGRTIRLPVHIIEQLTKLYGVSRQLQVELDRPPTTEEIAERMHTTPEKVREALRAARVPISLETPVGEDAEATLATFIADTVMRAPAEEAEEAVLAGALDAALHEFLTPREVAVLKLRFGLEDGRERSLGEVGEELKMSRERARQLEAEALGKLRKTPLRERFHEYLA